MRLGSIRHEAFTILELLVVIVILTLLIGLMVPGLSSARRQARRTQCLGNLHGLAVGLGSYTAEDPKAQVIPAHPIADVNPLHDEGYFDYGGATGAPNVWAGRRYGPHSERTSATRPLNRLLFGDTVPRAGDDAMDVFRCPGDVGVPNEAHAGNPRFWDPPMSDQPMFESVGTSYGANAYRARGSLSARDEQLFYSIGPFLRSSHTIPFPSLTVTLYDAVMWYNSRAEGRTGPVGWQALPGWHGNGPEYNVSFADGHTEKVLGWAEGLWAEDHAEYRNVQLRSRKFRFDCLPAPPIEDLPREIEEW